MKKTGKKKLDFTEKR